MSDKPTEPDEPTGPESEAERPEESIFTKEPQPELSLEERKKKAGLTRNRIGIWIVVGAFALYLIITGLVGILTKAR